ncbi:MAG: WYL domain-containing protein [Bacteroidales bacterium]|nr:WYL domain-containing protein [Bacteroidales bacterium]
MDQPKIERMLRLMQLLSGNRYYSIDELAETLELSRRSIFRYFDTFKSAGFVVQHIGGGRYRMTTYNKEYTDISQLVYFSEEEAIVVSHLIENLDATNALKAGLRQKLAAVYDSTSISDYIDNKGKSEIVETLANAVKAKRQVALKDYSSAHSGKAKDYVVEPYKFTRGFVDIIAYDTAAGINKVFKISRIDTVKILSEGWKSEDCHEEKIIDSFRMSGSPVEHVRLKLSLMAKNLLTEEFPVTGAEVYQQKRSWFWEGDVNSLEGIGRFVLGLSDEITVEEGPLLKAWLSGKGANIQKKFSTGRKR